MSDDGLDEAGEPAGPPADALTDGDVSRVVAAGDEARIVLDEITARDPAVGAARKWLDERTAAVRLVADAYVTAGVSRLRADRAATVWLLSPRSGGPPQGPRAWLGEADAGTWRRPGDPAGGLGQR